MGMSCWRLWLTRPRPGTRPDFEEGEQHCATLGEARRCQNGGIKCVSGSSCKGRRSHSALSLVYRRPNSTEAIFRISTDFLGTVKFDPLHNSQFDFCFEVVGSHATFVPVLHNTVNFRSGAPQAIKWNGGRNFNRCGSHHLERFPLVSRRCKICSAPGCASGACVRVLDREDKTIGRNEPPTD